MKKIIFAALMLCFIAAILTSCTNNVITPTSIPAQQILGKWTMSTATTNTVFIIPTAGTNSKDTTRFTSADYFNFKADSTVEILAGGVAHNGRWKIVNNMVIFTGTNYMDAPTTGWTFPILTGSHLEFYSLQANQTVSTEFKLDLIR
jgi:hypothetical protein